MEAYLLNLLIIMVIRDKFYCRQDLKLILNPQIKRYIEDIKYKRDDFNSITGVELKDNYRKAQKHFRKKFGKKYKLKKSLIVKMK